MNKSQLEKAQHLLSQGDNAGASGILDDLLNASPQDLQALHLAGMAALQRGDYRQAADLWQRAVTIDDQRSVLFSNLGIAQQGMGDLDAALQSLRRAAALGDTNAVNHYNLGLALYEADRNEEAEAAFRESLRCDPRYMQARYNLANVIQEQGGREREAEQIYREITQLAPDLGEAHHNLGLLLVRRGASDEAIHHYQRALTLGVALAGVFLGDLYLVRRQPIRAQECYRRALQVEPGLADAHGKLGLLLLELGDRERGMTHIIKSLEIAPDRVEFWQTFARAAAQLPSASPDKRYAELLERALRRPGVDPLYLAAPAAKVLERRYALTSRFSTADHPWKADALQRDAEIFDDSLLLAVLTNTLVTTAGLEQCLTVLRRVALHHRDHEFVQTRLPLLAALATQCFRNEFVWAETESEADAVETLRDSITEAIESDRAIDPIDVCVLGCYEALSALPGAQQLNTRDWPEPVFVFLHDTLTADLVERRLRDTIPTLTEIRESTSRDVRAQYEESPYPRWIRVESKQRGETAALLRSTFPDIDYRCSDPPRVLVAGCGTGRHVADVAWHYADAEILAIDLSLTSLAYAKRMNGVYGHDNVTFRQADLLELDDLEMQFDVIECSGVLHHLKDPLRGWQVLVDRLRSGGFMRVGLYSRVARRPVSAARALVTQHGLPPTLPGIRALRAKIRDAGPDNAAFALTTYYDFFSASTCRDLMFHVQEHTYTPVELAVAMHALGLEFLGFNLLSADVQRQYTEQFPGDPRMLDLEYWQQFEQDHPDLFTGMYQFWCRKPG